MCTYLSLEYFKFEMEGDSPRIELYFHYMDEDLSKYLRKSSKPTPQQVRVLLALE